MFYIFCCFLCIMKNMVDFLVLFEYYTKPSKTVFFKKTQKMGFFCFFFIFFKNFIEIYITFYGFFNVKNNFKMIKNL